MEWSEEILYEMDIDRQREEEKEKRHQEEMEKTLYLLNKQWI